MNQVTLTRVHCSYNLNNAHLQSCDLTLCILDYITVCTSLMCDVSCYTNNAYIFKISHTLLHYLVLVESTIPGILNLTALNIQLLM